MSRIWCLRALEHCEKFPGREQNGVMVAGSEQKGMFAYKKSMGLRLQVEAVLCICLYRARVES